MDLAVLDSVALTDLGCRRANNEDAVLRLPVHGVFCVADGMGGGEEGELASEAVIGALERQFAHLDPVAAALPMPRKLQTIGEAIDAASDWIKTRSRRKAHQGMGTTVVLLAFDGVTGNRAAVLHAGDSRAYRFRAGALERLTRDHSVAAVLNLDKQQNVPAMLRNVITRSVGMDETTALDTAYVDVAGGDLFLLCSDGLTNMISDPDLERMLQQGNPRQLSVLVNALVERAKEAGGLDNISAVLVTVGDLPSPPRWRQVQQCMRDWLDNRRAGANRRGLYELD